MALRWNLEDIADYENVCYIDAQADSPAYGIKKGERIMNPLTNVLIWATIGVGLGAITEKNADEFYARLSLLETIDGPYLIRPQLCRECGELEDHGNHVEHPYLAPRDHVTPEEVHAHIGLSCNVTDETRTGWLKRISNELDTRKHHYRRAMERAPA